MNHFGFFGHTVSASILVAVIGACAPIRYVRVADPVGPAPSSAGPHRSGRGHGYLVVHTGTDRTDVGDDTYHPHSSYRIYDLRGHLLRQVKNHDDSTDEEPSVVTLKPATYLVRGQASSGQHLEVRVRIESGLTTKLHLDGKWTPPRKAPRIAIARAQDGTPIGWHARAGTTLGTEGELRYEGSSTVASFVRDAKSVYTRASITIDDRGESDAGEVAVLGTADLGGVARTITNPSKRMQCTTIGFDAIVVVVRADSPIKGLTSKQLAGVFSGMITDWSKLGGPTGPVTPLIVAKGSATRAVFHQAIMKGRKYNALVVSPDREIISRVARSTSMIGQVSMALIRPGDKVKVLSIDGKMPRGLGAASYPIVRPLNVCVRRGGSKLAHNFVRWSLSSAGQKVVRRRFIGVSHN